MSEVYESTEANCLEIAGYRDALYGLPRPGTQFGEGPHIPLPATWDRANSTGWSSWEASVKLHPTGTKYKVDLDKVSPHSPVWETAKLTPSAKGKLTAARALAKQPGDSWYPAAPAVAFNISSPSNKKVK